MRKHTSKKFISFILAAFVATTAFSYAGPQQAFALGPDIDIPGGGGGGDESSDVCESSGIGLPDIDEKINEGIDTAKKVGEKIISEGLDTVLGSIPFSDEILGGIFGGIFGGGDDGPSGEDEDPITNKPKCEILDARRDLLGKNKNQTKDLINELLKNYKITDYLTYARNLAYKVYVTKQVLQRDAGDQAIILSNARRMLGINPNEPDLEHVYRQKALASSGLCISVVSGCGAGTNVTSKTALYNSMDLNKIIDPMTTTSYGQRLYYETLSSSIVATGSASTNTGIVNGSGNKDSYECKEAANGLKDCSIKNPGSLSQSNIDGQVSALANFQMTPPDWKELVAKVKNGPVNEFLKDLLLGGGGILGSFADYINF